MIGRAFPGRAFPGRAWPVAPVLIVGWLRLHLGAREPVLHAAAGAFSARRRVRAQPRRRRLQA